MAKNTVIAGDYENKKIVLSLGQVNIVTGFAQKQPVTASTVESYEVLDETSRKSAVSAIGRTAVGAFFLGPIGLAAGLTAKSKGTHTIAVQFKDGKKSLMEVDDKIYKQIMKDLF